METDKRYVIHFAEAIKLLETGERVTLRCWKLSTGDILTYDNVICIGRNRRAGTHRVELPISREKREFRDMTMFEINGMEVYR